MRIAALLVLTICTPAIAGPQSITVGGNFVKADREACALKAIQALGDAKFIDARIDKDGNVSGRDEKACVKVVFAPYKDGVHFVVAVAGDDNAHNERLRDTLRSRIGEAAVDPDAPREIKTTEPDRTPTTLACRWGLEQRATTPLVRFFIPVASVVLEKNGLKSAAAGNSLALGGNGESTIAVVVLPGPNEIHSYFVTIAFSANPDEADRLQNVVRTGLLRVLYD